MYGIACVAEWTCILVGLDSTTTPRFAIDVKPGGPPELTICDNSNWFSDVGA